MEDQVIFLDLREAIKTLTDYRNNLFEFLISGRGIEIVIQRDGEYPELHAVQDCTWLEDGDIYPGTKRNVLQEIKDVTSVVDGLIFLENFYSGGHMPWNLLPENFFEMIHLEMPDPRRDPKSVFEDNEDNTEE